MTSPSSSTSSSDAARYLLTAGLAALLLVTAVCAVSWIGISRGWVGWQTTQLLRYQVGKIDGLADIDVLLVGDSTLGNAIDARAWSKATGLKVASVALTGRYGYEGSLNMLRRALRRHQPRAVLVMQALDMATRRVATDGLLYTAERASDLRGASPRDLIKALANLDLAGAMLDGTATRRTFREIERMEYPRQHPRPEDGGPSREDADVLLPEEIRPEKVAFLGRIAAECRAADIACAYAHAPYPNGVCQASADYVAAVDAAVTAAGLTLVAGTPLCLPTEDLGDAPDHVRPERRPYYSEVLRRLASPALGLPP